MKHTKGPWNVGLDGNSFNEILIVPWGYDAIASINRATSRTRKENIANAQLIATAPELLEALKYVYENAASDSPEMWEMVSNAIDKAEGKK